MRATLTLRGFSAVALGVAMALTGTYLGSQVLVAIGVLFLAIVALSTLALLLRPRPRVTERTLTPRTLPVGESATVTVVLHARAWASTHAAWRDTLPPHLAPSGHFGVVELPRGTSSRLTYRARAKQRGVTHVGPLRITTADAFGVARRIDRIGVPHRVVVTPRIVPLRLNVRHTDGEGAPSGRVPLRAAPGESDLIPRVFLPGDSRSRVHWRATARTGDLMVRQEEPEEHRSVTILMDRASPAWLGDPEAFEVAVSLCASAALAFARNGHTVNVQDESGRGIGTAGRGQRSQQALLETLADVIPAPSGTVADAISNPHARGATGQVVIVTGAADDPRVQAFLEVERHGTPQVIILSPQDRQ